MVAREALACVLCIRWYLSQRCQYYVYCMRLQVCRVYRGRRPLSATTTLIAHISVLRYYTPLTTS